MDMKTSKGGWVARVILGAALGVLSSVVLASYLAESRGPTLAVSLLCAGLGGVLSAATLPFADDGRSLLLHSVVHFGATALLFGLLMAQLGARGAELLAWEAILFLLYAVVWLGRWIGWYVEVMQLRSMLGLAPGPSPLKWRETLPYLAFALLLCDVLPMLLFWADHAVSADVPVLSGLLLPYLLLPVAGHVPLLYGGRPRPGGQCDWMAVPPGGVKEKKLEKQRGRMKRPRCFLSDRLYPSDDIGQDVQ